MVIKVVGILVIVVIIGRIDYPFLRKEGNKKEITIYMTLLSGAIALSLSKIFKWGVPSPLYIVSWLCRPLSNLIKMLQ